jgi:hypothetical protein
MTTDQLRLSFYLKHPGERLSLIRDISAKCYQAWDTWDIGSPVYGVQLAYLFATIAGAETESWSFSLEMLEDSDGVNTPLAQALQELFHKDHAIWLFIERQWNGLPESSCPVCAHDCTGNYPQRVCHECGFDESRHDPKIFTP